ncbi:unnamed protein product [Vitrella brassicaformis CCMP3155]|uniref:Cyclin-dependent kinase 2 homolog n=1 Tax=Vitrella brassicaformis (strain CCMP3155) TaxID=1169540 RepID=A0A0G4G7V0_VITBC|nr:unnamed protein product [Vitrella brassicaformis CCMP3155]|eukprot:CEM24734.1 unnamed protein product [Vitrella brassicaformis CCMP3155]
MMCASSSTGDLSSLSSSASNSPAAPSPLLLDRYEIRSTLGEGTYGTVYLALDSKTGDTVAVKMIRGNEDEEGIPSTSLREVALLREISHHNLVKLYDIHCKQRHLYMVFEYVQTDLRHLIRRTATTQGGNSASTTSADTAAMAPTTSNSNSTKKDHPVPVGLPADLLKSLSYQLINGLAHLHGHQIVHRDMKPQNILIDQRGYLKIADFGLARMHCIGVYTGTQDVITLWYRPPELLLGQRVYGTEVDIWAAGCIIAEMATGRPLFPGDSEVDTLFKTCQLLGSPTEDTWPGMKNTLTEWRDEFPKWRSVHPFTALRKAIPTDNMPDEGIDMLANMVRYPPASRHSACRLLTHPFFDSVHKQAFEQP